jgi:hypothetical protein
MNKCTAPYCSSEVLFLDFLGFAAAVQNWNDERMEKLIEVLVAIADAQSNFDIKGESQADGSYKITSPAEITTFSDHIVVSYPRIVRPADVAVDLWGVISNGWAGMVREQMQKITAQVAIAGLGVGLLVRGGLSQGKLYHHGRVVVGEAMVDAYHLESKVARNARVVVSPRISDNDRLFEDMDGKRCLDYIGEMMLLAAPGDKVPPASSARYHAHRCGPVLLICACNTARMCRVSTQITGRPASAKAL